MGTPQQKTRVVKRGTTRTTLASTSRPWMEVLVIVVENTVESREIRPHGATKTFKTAEVVWWKHPEEVLKELHVAEKIWGFDLLYHGSPITKDMFWYYGKNEPAYWDLRNLDVVGPVTAQFISEFVAKRDAEEWGPRALLVYTDMAADYYNQTSGQPTIGGFTSKKSDHPELITDAAFIFSDQWKHAPDLTTTAHELGHLVGDLNHVDDRKNLMGKYPKPKPAHEPPIRGQVTDWQRNQFFSQGRKKGYIRNRRKKRLKQK